jgi:hypothetical protein
VGPSQVFLSLPPPSPPPTSVRPANQDPSRHQLEGANSKREVSFVRKCGASWQCSMDMQQTAERLDRRINSCERKVEIQCNMNKLENVKVVMTKWFGPRERTH